MSYFDYERIAEGYAVDRPVYHIAFMEKVKKELGLTGMLDKGLDVGCGAGSSAIALRRLCREVIGMDESMSMLHAAEKHCKDSRITFLQSRAEELDLEENSIDMITAAGSMNWVDETVFLVKAHKMLKSGGYFLVYDNAMLNQMEGNPSFTRWWEEEYLIRFPKPARKEAVWSEQLVSSLGFAFEKELKYPNKIAMTQEQLVSYLITQTNVIARVEQQGEPLAEAVSWFRESLEPYFDGKVRELWCDGYIWFLKNLTDL